jgi:hypothetical protein
MEGRGFSVEVVRELDDARRAVLARIPNGASVMTNQSVTLQETAIAEAIDGTGRYESARAKLMTLDRVSQMREVKSTVIQADVALGSVHGITRDGAIVIASALGSQLAAYAWGAASVILVAGVQKLVPDLAAAHRRIYEHAFKLEDVRALEAYGQHTRIGKILEIHEEDPGRIHVVLIRRAVGF